jgi:hypothetical protein
LLIKSAFKIRVALKGVNLSPEKKQQKKQLEKTIRQLESKKYLAKIEKLAMKDIENAFCNEECKGTIFESGNPNKLPDELRKKYKGKEMVKVLHGMRCSLFNRKKNILKDSFYEKLHDEEVKHLKQAGAISGCVVMTI